MALSRRQLCSRVIQFPCHLDDQLGYPAFHLNATIIGQDRKYLVEPPTWCEIIFCCRGRAMLRFPFPRRCFGLRIGIFRHDIDSLKRAVGESGNIFMLCAASPFRSVEAEVAMKIEVTPSLVYGSA